MPDRSGQHSGYADARAHLTNALACAQDSKKARTETIQDGKGPSLVRRVELTGLEPVTPCLQSRCATNCAIAP